MKLRHFAIAGLCLLLTSCATKSTMIDDSYDSIDSQGRPHTTNPADDAFKMGNRYILGQGVEKDYGQALSWFEKAAEDGSPYAQNELGYMYAAGKGVKRDYQTAIDWYTKASLQNLASAQYNLGIMYQLGLGTHPNKEKARALYQRAAQQGFDPARRALNRLN